MPAHPGPGRLARLVDKGQGDRPCDPSFASPQASDGGWGGREGLLFFMLQFFFLHKWWEGGASSGERLGEWAEQG